MRHGDKVELMRLGHKNLYERLSAYSVRKLPRHVDRAKLEQLYDMIDSQYELVLRRKQQHIKQIRL